MARSSRLAPLATAIAVCSMACGADEAGGPLRLEIPVEPAHRALVLAVEAQGRLELTAFELEDGEFAPLSRPLDLEGEVVVTALLYASPLAELSLEAGRLTPAEAAPDRALPPPTAIQRARVAGVSAEAWASQDTLPATLERFRLPALDPCPSLQPRVVELGRGAPPTATIGLDDTWALVTTAGNEVYFVDGVQAVRQTVPVAFFSGYRRSDGQIWLGGEGGAVYRATFLADPEPRLELVDEGFVDSRQRVIDLVGAPDGAVEHFALTSDLNPDDEAGNFEWFADGAWTRPTGWRRRPHDTTWVSRGYGLFASWFRGGQVYGAADGMETEINVSTVVFGNVVMIEQIPGLGLVAGTTGGEIHVDDGVGTWRQIPTRATQRIGEAAPYPDGFVYVHDTSVNVFVAGQLCESVSVFDAERTSVNDVDVVGANVIVALTPREGVEVTEQRVAWFAPQ